MRNLGIQFEFDENSSLIECYVIILSGLKSLLTFHSFLNSKSDIISKEKVKIFSPLKLEKKEQEIEENIIFEKKFEKRKNL